MYDFNLKDLEILVEKQGYKKYKALQIFKWLYQKRINAFSEMTDVKKDFIKFLKKIISYILYKKYLNKSPKIRLLNFYLKFLMDII